MGPTERRVVPRRTRFQLSLSGIRFVITRRVEDLLDEPFERRPRRTHEVVKDLAVLLDGVLRARFARRLQADDDALLVFERLASDLQGRRNLRGHTEVLEEALVRAPEVAPQHAVRRAPSYGRVGLLERIVHDA